MKKVLKSLPILAMLLSGCALLEQSSVEQRVVYSEGAYICTPDDAVHISIPPMALSQDTTITIDPVPDHEPLGGLERVGMAWDFGPDGTQFREPVWVTLHPELPAGVSVNELSLFHESRGEVEELEGVIRDEASGTISGYASHFSIFYAAYAGPSTGRGIFVGGDNLQPLFGGSTTSVSPTEVPLWIKAGGLVSTDPYSGQDSENLVIQVNGTPALANTQFFIEGWTISPVDPGGTVVGPTGDRISTSGFWFDFFAREIRNPLRQLRTDSEGRLTLVIRGDHLYQQIQNAPAGYPSGRYRLRVFAEDGSEAVDIILAMSLFR